MEAIRNGSTAQYRKVGKCVVRFHECPDGYDDSNSTCHRYLVHFYTGVYAGSSRHVWLSTSDVIEEKEA